MEKKPRTKKDIRRQILAVRRTLPAEEAKEKSREIFQKVTAHPWYIEADTVFCYASHDGEVRTRELMDQILADGKRLALPRVEGREMTFYEVREPERLEEGAYGIEEPLPENPVRKEHSEKALMIIPGIVFDRRLHRIGYGGGFYDRYLAGDAPFHTMAVAYECQCILGELPFESHDLCPEVLVTEREIYQR